MKVWPAVKVEVFGSIVFGAVGVLLAVAAPARTSAVAVGDTRTGNSNVIVAAVAAVLES